MSIKKTYIPAKPRSSKLVGTSMSGGIAPRTVGGSGGGMTAAQVATLNNLASWWKLDDDGNLFSELNVYSTEELGAYGYGGSGGGSGGGIIETVYGYSNLGQSFNNTTLTDTFNAYTINQINNRLLNVEAGGGGGANDGTLTLATGTGLTGSATFTANQSSNSTFTVSPIFGTTAGTIAQGNDSRIINGQTAYGWGNHASAGYALSSRIISAGTGLTGGGNLSANRTLSLDTAYTDNRYYGYTDSAISDIEIGGRNYLLKSENFSDHRNNNNSVSTFASGVDEIGQWLEGYRFDNGTFFISTFIMPLASNLNVYSENLIGTKVISSVEVMSPYPIRVWLATLSSGNRVILEPNVWTQITGVSAVIASRTSSISADIGGNGDIPKEGVKLYHRRWKVEKGNKATDWTPAPEDVQAEIDSKLSLTGGTLTGSLTAPNFIGSLSGNASTATTLANSRSISITGDVSWSVNFNGGSNVTAAGTIQSNAVTTAKILNNNVTFAKIENIATNRILGRSSSGTGNIEALTTIPSAVLGNSSLYIGTTEVALNRGSGLLSLNLGGGDISGVRDISAYYLEVEDGYIDGDLWVYGTVTSGNVNTPKLSVGSNWTIELSGTELLFKYNNVTKQRMFQDGSFAATGEVAAYSEGVTSDELQLNKLTLLQGGGVSKFLTSANDQIYFSMGSISPIVMGETYVRRGTSANNVDLGTSAYPWANIYGVNFRASTNITTPMITLGNGWTIEQTSASLTIRRNRVVKGTFTA